MAYIMECYANMRGTFFVWHLKCDSKNQIQKLGISQATRSPSCLLHQVVNNDGVFECDTSPQYKVLWESAEDCVFELAGKEEEDSIDE